jgi:hypothetical protein
MIYENNEAIPIPRQEVKKALPIIIIGEDPFAVVAAVHDVVTRLFGPLLLARFARHAQLLLCIAGHRPDDAFMQQSRFPSEAQPIAILT